MTRDLYRFVLWLHPPTFRYRFRDEMLGIFDEGYSAEFPRTLLWDGLVSLARQWVLRTDYWSLLLVAGIVFIQFSVFGVLFMDQQKWNINHSTVTPYMEQVLFIAAGLLCSIFILVTSLVAWNTHFQRRHLRYRRHGRSHNARTSRSH